MTGEVQLLIDIIKCERPMITFGGNENGKTWVMVRLLTKMLLLMMIAS